MAIKEFFGRYRFLSNFYESPVVVFGMRFNNAEAAYQSQKDPSKALLFSTLVAGAAKRVGRLVRLRKDWDEVKDLVMEEVVRAKFRQDETLRRKLMETKDEYLEEGNTWGDRYWGTVNGVGDNKLGQILMKIRAEFLQPQ